MPIYTSADLDADRTVSCDVCIVGSGAGGAHVAQRLATAGVSVVVLEDGGFETSDTFDLREANMNPRLYQEGAGRATADLSISVMQGRAVAPILEEMDPERVASISRQVLGPGGTR